MRMKCLRHSEAGSVAEYKRKGYNEEQVELERMTSEEITAWVRGWSESGGPDRLGMEVRFDEGVGDAGAPDAKSINEIADSTYNRFFKDKQLKTENSTSFFWSGKSNGIGGMDIAANIAKKNGGATLEMVLEREGIILPEFNILDSTAVEIWQNASAVYAKQVSGHVRAIVGSNVNPKGVWLTIELPALKNNPNVTKITLIDQKHMLKKLFLRGEY